jgi:hypothetical protein
MFAVNSSRRRSVVAILAVSLLGGCAGGGIGSPSQLAVAPGDPCGLQRQAFGQSQTYFTDKIVTGAVTGGALGALGGAAIGGLAGGWRGAGIGALIGAGTGAVVGGVSTYYGTMAERYQDQDTLARAINADLTRESQETEHVTATFARVRECRLALAGNLRQQVRARTIDRAVARDQLNWQRDRYMEELALADQYRVAMQRRDEEFRTAAQSLEANQTVSSSTPRAAAAPPTRQVVVAATETVPEKRSAFAASIASARTQGQVAFNLDEGSAS